MRAALLVALLACRGEPEPAPPRFMLVKGTLTWDDVHEVERELPPAAPMLQKTAQLVSEDDQNWMTRVIGTTPDYFIIRKLALAEGRMFTPTDGGKLVVIGDKLVETLHAKVGQTLRIDTKGFTVIGVLAHQGVGEVGEDRDDAVYVLDEQYKRLGDPRDVKLLVGDPSRIEQLRELLHTRHLGKDDFTISSPP